MAAPRWTKRARIGRDSRGHKHPLACSTLRRNCPHEDVPVALDGEDSLGLECCEDIDVTTSVEFPHFEDDFAVFLVALGYLISLVQPVNLLSTADEESVLEAISVSNVLIVSVCQLRRAYSMRTY